MIKVSLVMTYYHIQKLNKKNTVCYMKESKVQDLSMRNHEDYVKYGQPCNGHGTSYHQCRQLELDGGR